MRSPDQTIQRHRVYINIAALVIGALSFLIMFDSRYQAVGAMATSLTLVVWVLLILRVTPNVADYQAYTRIAAEKEGLGEWLAQIEAEFTRIWEAEREADA